MPGSGSASGAQRPPVVRAVGGTVQGQWESEVAVFRGIPFARPPVGALRLAPPEPAPPWEGTRRADAFGESPPQSRALGLAAGPDNLATGSGDWLTVNVWTPDPGGSGMPVLVWVHGGVYLVGTSDGTTYDGTELARRGTVVVTFNHRVGAEGYAQFEGAVPNRALLDQVAALHWVRENIAAFGGEPDLVTVFGESAGAGAIAALLAMDRAAGLFRRAVTQSVPGPFYGAGLAADIGSEVAAELGVAPTLADVAAATPGALRDAADKVVGAMARYEPRWGRAARARMPFAPVVDGDVLPCTPWEALRAGRGAGVELLCGHTRDETRLFTVLAGRVGRVTAQEAAATLEWFAPDAAGRAAYRAGPAGGDPTALGDLVLSDWLFRMPSLHLAEAHTEGGGTAYTYELAWEAPGLGGAAGACHGLDVPLVLGALRSEFAALLLGDEPPPAAAALSARMGEAWTAFAATGDPGWAPYRAPDRLTRVFDATPHTAPYPEEVSRLIWAGHEFAALEPAPAPGPEHRRTAGRP
ncbi:carboxylesterase family protein [Streptomyces sp. p1417]|uniref:Carboxylic ester hydrolase n=1 Tax=Streptomyces typhae TaxID=2681492 RepID=A0A6L6X9U2_9ACTN|nr:carboxylesterase family protein [Streptomyces typhae]MVO90725.1 carboxylesterase family protein [Streptomyces typhae]